MKPRRRTGGKGRDAAAALAGLRRGEVAPVYLLHGPEAFLREECVRAIRQAVLEEGTSAFNHDRFEWPETEASDVAAAAQTLPFMARRRLVEVRGFDQVTEREAAVLSPLLEAPPSTAVLLFVADKADMRSAIFRRMGEAGFALRMETPPERDLPAWLRAQADGLGFTLSREAAALLVEMVEPSLGRLRGELEKLASFLTPGEVAGEEAVRELVGRSKVEAMFKLGDALASGKTPRALGLMRRLAEADPPQVLLGMLRNQVRRWTITKAALRKGVRPRELAGILGVLPFAVERLERQVRGASARFLRGLYGKLLAVDRRIKRSSEARGDRRALEVFVMEMHREADGFAGRGEPAAPGAKESRPRR